MCHHLLALNSPNRWGCLCCLSDGTHHQLYESPLFLIHQTWQHRGRDRRRTEWVIVETPQSRNREGAGGVGRRSRLYVFICTVIKHKLYLNFMMLSGWAVCTDWVQPSSECCLDCLSCVHSLISFLSPVSCSKNAVIVSQSLSSDPATPHRLSTKYAPCSWNCQEWMSCLLQM